MALSAGADQNQTTSPVLNDLQNAVANTAADITTATTSDIMIMFDASDNYELKYADANNVLELIGATATAAELNYLDITTLGTGAASKAVVLDASKDYLWPSAGTLTMWTATSGLILGSGATGGYTALGATAGNALEFYLNATHTTGDMRGEYLRLRFSGAGGSGEALRAFGEVNNVSVATGGTVNGAHITLQLTGASAAVSGAGNALRATLGLATGTTASGTLSGIQVDADFASDATLTAAPAGIRFTTATSKKWPIAFAFDSVVGTGNAIEAATSAMSTNATSHAIHITIDGVDGYIPVYDNKTWS